MATAGLGAPVVASSRASTSAPNAHGSGAVDGATAAWLAAIPCALVTALAVLLVGPALKGVLLPTPHLTLLPGDTQRLTPEPLEDTRYMIALVGPLLLAGAAILVSRAGLVLRPRWAAAGVAVTQALIVAFALVCVLAQHQARWAEIIYFGWVTLAVAVPLAAALVLAPRLGRVRAVAARVLRDTLRWRFALLALAAVLTAIWLLPAINTETSIEWAFLSHDTQFHLDETFAVLNGLTPLVNFNAQYASLFPYLIAIVMRAFEPTLLVFTITLCTLSLVVLLSIYGVLRRAAGSAAAGFALLVPFRATSLFKTAGIQMIRFAPGVYFPMFPLRYGGAYLLAWLVARQLGRPRTRAWPLFVAAGFALLNNFEFGVAALGATAGALLVTAEPLSARRVLRLAGAAAAGVGAAIALYAVVTLVRAGSLPHPWRLVQFARLYGAAGYSVAPLPGVVGLPLAIYVTHVAAIATATVRARRGARNRVLTGMLMWAGLFGLSCGTYYVARSSAGLLPMMFSAWAFALCLLAIVVMRQIAAAPSRIPGLGAVAVLFGIGLLACSVAQVPVPWQQIQRVQQQPANLELPPEPWTPTSQNPRVRFFISSIADGPGRFVVKHGAPVAIFTTLGHRIADAYGIVNVLPYTGPESIHTPEQLTDTLDALRSAGGNTAIVPFEHLAQLSKALLRRGFRVVTRTGLGTPTGATLPPRTIVLEDLTKWVDTRR